jgi:hypothetical protein
VHDTCTINAPNQSTNRAKRPMPKARIPGSSGRIGKFLGNGNYSPSRENGWSEYQQVTTAHHFSAALCWKNIRLRHVGGADNLSWRHKCADNLSWRHNKGPGAQLTGADRGKKLDFEMS